MYTVPRAQEAFDLKVLGAMHPRPLNQILPLHLVYNLVANVLRPIKKYQAYYLKKKPALAVHPIVLNLSTSNI